MSTIVETLTRDIVAKDLRKEGASLIKKWEETGLLKGLNEGRAKNNMAVLLENQAKELLREATSMSAGDVEGFAAVAFPIVRRVFGGLIANELVQVQPMSLPSGLIFFMDFVYSGQTPGKSSAGVVADESIYGGGVVAGQLTGGVDLGATAIANAEKSFYSLNNGLSTATGSLTFTVNSSISASVLTIANWDNGGSVWLTGSEITGALDAKWIQYDPDVQNDTSNQYMLANVQVAADDWANNLDRSNLVSIGLGAEDILSSSQFVRRLTAYSGSQNNSILRAVIQKPTANGEVLDAEGGLTFTLHYSRKDSWQASNAIGSVLADLLPAEGAGSASQGATYEDGANLTIPEIDIKLDSIAVTATTKKLKAKWTPEVAQDINAYHNLDAEVELTGILSEHVALEIDQEILNDLIKGATAATLYWNRKPGQFVNRETGASITSATAPPDFTGTVSEWYETLVETMNDVSARIHRKTLRGGANFVVTSPEVANLLEFTSGFRATVSHEDLKGGAVGAEKVGSMSRKWDVYVDPYFLRNLILIGRRGKSFLESGYVYSPYVPLQTTPTIFGVEDFIPRKGIMTRYAKKMVRPDMYGLVVVQDLV